MHVGTIAAYDQASGNGCISLDDGREASFADTSCRNVLPRIGARVKMELVDGRNGELRARRVEPLQKPEAPKKRREVLPASEMQKRHGLYAENWRPRAIAAESVPEHLATFCALAEEWGIDCDVTRADKLSKTKAEALQRLITTIEPIEKAVDAWFDSYDIAVVPAAAWQFMYMLKAADEARTILMPRPSSHEIDKARTEFREAIENDLEAALRRLDASDSL